MGKPSLPLWASTQCTKSSTAPQATPLVRLSRSPPGLSAQHSQPARLHTNYHLLSLCQLGPAGQPFSPFLPAIFPVSKPPRRPHGRCPPAALAPWDGGHAPPVPHLHRPLPCPQTLAPPYKNPHLAPLWAAAAPLGIPPCPPQEGEEEGEKEKPEEKRTGKPHWGEPDVVAPLDHLVAARPAGEAAGRGTPVHGPRSRSCSSRRRPPLHQAEPPASSSPCCSPPRQNAKERGCCTRKMSLRKPWTAPLCFLCSRPFHATRFTSSPPCPGAQGEPQPPSPCCGPGLRAEAGPNHVSSLLVCCLLSRIVPPCRPVVA
jgi:hypothetical protein